MEKPMDVEELYKELIAKYGVENHEKIMDLFTKEVISYIEFMAKVSGYRPEYVCIALAIVMKESKK